MANIVSRISKKIFTKTKFIIYGLAFISFALSFFAGAFSQDMANEKIADYISSVVLKNVPTKDLLSISLERNDGGSLPNSETEFRQLYGVFRQEKITFASGYNMTKENIITIDEISSDNNLSAVYIGSTTGSIEYKGHYKDETYPVELMFPLSRYDPVSMQTAIISRNQADALLANRKPDYQKIDGEYSSEQYETLIGEPLEITINGSKVTFVIQDIFYEDTYYPTGLYHTVGDFFFTSYYFPTVINKQNVYFMCSYSYENSFFIKYINTVYKNGSYSIKCVKQLVVGSINENMIIGFYKNNNQKNTIICILLIVLSATILLSSIFVNFIDRKSSNIAFLIAQVVFSLVPFLIFSLAFLISKNIVFFSNYGNKLNAIFILIYLLSSVLILLIKNKGTNKPKIIENKYYECDI